jgi:hypothetical protein
MVRDMPQIVAYNCMDLLIQIGQGSADGKNSTYGVCFSLCYVMISWDSKKQKSLLLNTAEAKYIATFDACTIAV